MRQGRATLRRLAFLRALGAAMRARRLSLKLTIVEIADRLGESPAAVRRMEAGARNVSVLRLERIARALGLSLSQVLKLAERRARREKR